MGVLSNLIVLNAEGLEQRLEELQALLEAQEERLKSIEAELNINVTLVAHQDELKGRQSGSGDPGSEHLGQHKGQQSGDPGSEHLGQRTPGADKSPGVASDRSQGIASFDSWGSGQRMSAPMQELSRRLMQSQEQQAEYVQRVERLEQASQNVAELQRQVLEEQAARQSLLSEFRNLESRLNKGEASFGDARADCLKCMEATQAEFKRSYKAFEARCTLSEEKASECRREARAVRDEHGGRDLELSELQQQVRSLHTWRSQSALDGSQVDGSTRDRSLMSDVEAQITDLDSRMRAKASECVVEAMRQDLEQSGRAVQDAVKVLMQQMADQEDRLRGLETSAAQARSRDRRGGDPSAAEEELQVDGDASSHCLLCHTAARSVSPNRVILGSDNRIYGIAADPSRGPPEAAELLASLASLSSIAGARAQNSSRPNRGPAISASRSGQQVLHSPWVDGGSPGTSSAVTSNLRGMRRRQQQPACKGKLSDFVGDSSSMASAAASGRTRPSSASSLGERGRRSGLPVARPASASYERGRDVLGNSASLPTLDRSDGATAPETLVP